jgi:hypothetical protein
MQVVDSSTNMHERMSGSAALHPLASVTEHVRTVAELFIL